jgi:hypothetical protein
MNFLWSINADDYEEVVRRAKEAGLTPGDSMEAIFLEYMAEKNQKPISANEFTKDELLQQLAGKNGNVLDIATDKEGKQSYKIVKKVEPTLDNDIPDVV